LAVFAADGAHYFLLRHLAFKAAKGALNLPEVAEFFAQSHIAICDQAIADCYC
jgi:hypothetical protein